MTRLNELKQARIEARDTHAALLDGHLAACKTESRSFSDEEKTAQTAAEGKVKGLDEQVGAEERRLELVRATAPSVNVGADRATEKPWESGPKGLGDWAMAVKRAQLGHGLDPRLAHGMSREQYQAAASGMGEAYGPDGGFAVPVEQASGIEREMFTVGDLLSRVDTRDISGNAITYNIMKETSRADGSRQGGVLGYWIDEGESPDATKFQLSKIELKLRKVGCLGYLTEELEADAMALGQELQRAFADELIFQVENKIYRGSGAGSPLGFMVAPCVVSVAKETSQVAAPIVGRNLAKMWARMPARSRANAVWLVNVDCDPQLDELVFPIGATTPEARFVNYGPDGILRIKGRPVVAVEYAETLGTQGDIALVDMSRYRLIRKGGVQQASSIHVRFSQGENTYRAIYRVDGQPVPRSAITPFKGTATLSPFVILDTRA